MLITLRKSVVSVVTIEAREPQINLMSAKNGRNEWKQKIWCDELLRAANELLVCMNKISFHEAKECLDDFYFGELHHLMLKFHVFFFYQMPLHYNKSSSIDY